MQTITFSVRYTRDEYLSFVSDHALLVGNQQRVAKGKPRLPDLPWWMRAMIRAIATPVYFYKLSKVGECRFTIDEQQLVRETKDGAMTVPWRDVVAVHQHSQCWLVAKAHGAMPLPFRCMSDTQRAEFAQFVRGLPRQAAAVH
jgi:hypothetical protein